MKQEHFGTFVFTRSLETAGVFFDSFASSHFHSTFRKDTALCPVLIWRSMFFGGGWETIAAAALPADPAMQEPILTDGRLLYLPDRNLLYLLIAAGYD